MPPPKIPSPIPTRNDLRSMVTEHQLDRIPKNLSDADARRERVFHRSDWKAYVVFIRQHIREVFGEMLFGKDGGPLNTRLVSAFETRHCRIENVLFGCNERRN